MLYAPGRLLSPIAGGVPPTLDLNFMGGAMPSGITFTRASTGWYFNASGVLTSAATDTPRFDYNPVTLAAKGLLIEEARTNLFLNSAVGVTQSCTVAAAANTLSFFGTGTITLTGTSTAGPLVGTGAATRVSLTFTPTAGSLTLTVSGSVTNVQLELGAFATSPIVTVGSTVTRAVDVATITPLGSWYSATAGTVTAEFSVNGGTPPGTTAAVIVGYDDGTTANRIQTRRLTDGSFSRVVVVASSVAVNSAVLSGTLTENSVHRVATAWATNDLSGAVNGTVSAPGGTFVVPTVTRLALGTGSAVPTLNGYLRRVRVYDQRLANASLQVLTS